MTEWRNFPGKFPRNFLEEISQLSDTWDEKDQASFEDLAKRAQKMLDASPQHERVPFRLMRMPCCGHILCWVNPRFPTYCPSCGKAVFVKVKESVLLLDDNAILTLFTEGS